MADQPRIAHETRLPALDGLRGIAILLVLMFHYEVRDFPRRSIVFPLWAVIQEGWLGVDLFFVLSGFLITGILCDTRDSRGYFRNFYARRTLRIFPLYYGSLLVIFLVLPQLPAVLHLQSPSLGTQAWFWLYLSNVLIALKGWSASPLIVPHFWSLAVEEQFYLLWPAIVFLAGRRTLLRICFACVVVAFGVRIGLRFSSLPWYAGMVLTPARLDALALGGIVALLVRGPLRRSVVARWAGWATLVTGLLCATLFAWRDFRNGEDRIIGTLGFSAFDLFAASVVAVGATWQASSLPVRILTSAWLRIVGRYSYGMYVFHVVVLKLLDEYGLSIHDLTKRCGSGLAAHVINVGANVALTLSLAALSHRFIETRFLLLKDRFLPGELRKRASDDGARSGAKLRA